MSLETQALRQVKQKEWVAATVHKAAAGDARALVALRNRQSACFARQAYASRAGGQAKAVSDLQAFYQRKYASTHERPAQLAEALLHEHVQKTREIQHFGLQELQDVIATCPTKKSTGADGISYEALQSVLQSCSMKSSLESESSHKSGSTTMWHFS